MEDKEEDFFKRLWGRLFPKTRFTINQPAVYYRKKRDGNPLYYIMAGIVGLAVSTMLMIGWWATWGEGRSDTPLFYITVGLLLAALLGWVAWHVPLTGPTIRVKETGFRKSSGQHVQILDFEDIEKCWIKRDSYRGEDFFVLLITRKKSAFSFLQHATWDVGLPGDFPVEDFLKFLLEKGVPVKAVPND